MRFDPNKITFFARTDARGQNVPFGIKAKDRQRHVYVIGKTGMGKSTLLENMAVQDIQSGEGMAFIDPHGSAAETLLNYIPEHRIKDVLYFAPFDSDHPVSFNIMEDVGPDKRHLVVSGLMSVFKKIWVDAWSARMEYILSNTLLALLEYPGSTLLGVNRMLSDKEYRKLVVDNVKDPSVKAFWVDEFAKYNERYMQEAGDAIKNKIGQFTANPIIRNIVGQPKSSFDIRKMMDEQKILIINLSKGLIGETNANLLGSMLTTRIYLAAMSRADLSPEKMRDTPNFYFYVDEFQSFANATFANILSEARKYHLNLTIAHQYIEQMEEEVRNAVFGNVGTIVSFRVGPFDAEVLETIFTPQFLATDIVNLGFAQVYLTLMIDGIGSQPFSATTLPPIQPPTISYRDVVVASSRQQFSHSREEVELEIQKFHTPVPTPQKPRSDEARPPQRPLADVQKFPRREQSDFPEKRNAEEREVRGRVERAGREELPRPREERPRLTLAPEQSERLPRPPESQMIRREERREDRRNTDRNHGEKQQHQTRRPVEDVGDLRSLLKSFAEKEKDKLASVGSGAAQTPDGKKEREEKFAASRGELKEMIAEVLKESQSLESSKSVSVVPQQHEKKGVQHPTAPLESVAPGEKNVSPGEIERMMRVTKGDSLPY